jgi:hypothetical protein
LKYDRYISVIHINLGSRHLCALPMMIKKLKIKITLYI